MNIWNFNSKDVYNRCVLSSIAHAVYTFSYPFFSYEQSWYENTFCFIDNTSRGAISFDESHTSFAGAISDDKSSRRELYPQKDAADFFVSAGDKEKWLAKNVAIEFLYDEIDEVEAPVVTTGFWSDADKIVCYDSDKDFDTHGGSFVNILLAPDNEFNKYINETYLKTDEDMLLFKLFTDSFYSGNHKIKLSHDIKFLKKAPGFKEGKESLMELGLTLR